MGVMEIYLSERTAAVARSASQAWPIGSTAHDQYFEHSESLQPKHRCTARQQGGQAAEPGPGVRSPIAHPHAVCNGRPDNHLARPPKTAASV